MKCKNCENVLSRDDQYCASCGAKVIHERLTFKSLWQEFTERFLNYDNTIFKTFRHLFTQPEVVIDSYINGTRKKYLNVFNYFALSVTIAGIFTFFFLKFYGDVYRDALDVINAAQNTDAERELFNNTMQVFFDYQSIMFFLTIPILALISKIVFYNYKKYNYTEHAVIYLYAYSHGMNVVNIVYLFVLLISPTSLGFFTMISIPFYILYIAYVLKRLYAISLKKIILKTLLFLVVGAVFYVIFIIIFGIIAIIVMLLDGSMMELIEQERKLRGK